MADTIIVNSVIESTYNEDSESFPKDLNGDECAILSVSTDLKGLQFGNIIDYHTNSDGYNIYLLGGTRKVVCYHSNILPTEINFNDYGIKYLKPGHHYVLKCTILQNNGSKIDLFADTPEMVFARYNYADSISSGSDILFEVKIAIQNYCFDNRYNWNEEIIEEKAAEHILPKYTTRIQTYVHNAISAVKLGYAPALEILWNAYYYAFSRPYVLRYIDELKQDWENEMSRMIFDYIAHGYSAHIIADNPLEKTMQESLDKAIRMIDLPDVDEINITLPLNDNTINLLNKILEYNITAKRLENYRIECKITEPNIQLYGKFLNRLYYVSANKDQRYAKTSETFESSRKSYLRLKLMLLWQQIKEFEKESKISSCQF